MANLLRYGTTTTQKTSFWKPKEEEDVFTRIVLFEKKMKSNSIFHHRENLGLLSGLRGHSNSNLALLFESQASQIIREDYGVGISSRSFDSLKKETFFLKIKLFFKNIYNRFFKKNKNIPQWNGVELPLIRHIVNDIVSAQPLSQPTGMLFYFDGVEKENVYKKIVIFEKYKQSIRRYPIEQDYFIPVRDGHVIRPI